MDVSTYDGLVLVLGIATTLLTAQLTARDGSDVPLLSETLCWTFITLWFRIAPQLYRECGNAGVVQSTAFKYSEWVAAIFIAVAALFSTTGDISSLMPIVTPALILLRNTSLLPQFSQSYPRYIRSSWIQFIIGTISVLSLLPALDYSRYALIAIAIVSLTGLYAMLVTIFEPNIDLSHKHPQLSVVEVVKCISSRAIFLLAIPCLALFVSTTSGILPVATASLLTSCLKAIHWVVLFYIVREVPWEVATLTWTFAATTNGASIVEENTALGLFKSFGRASAASVSLLQVIAFLPRSTHGRYLLLIFAVWPCLLLVKHTSIIDRTSLVPEIGWFGKELFPNTGRHPIEDLILKGQNELAQLIDRQSRTLEEAEVEYHRRYSRSPPPGFDKWFAYARKKESIIIDDFDMIHDNLKPFWTLSPERLKESMNHVTKFDHLSIKKCEIKDGSFHGPEREWIPEDIARLLEDVVFDMPDVQFALSTIDEPREIISQEILDSGGTDKPAFQLEGHHSIWDRVSRPCQPDISQSPKTSLHTYGIPFVQNAKEAKDVCRNPRFEHMHGLFSSPETCKTTNAPVPILSQAVPSTYGDIIIPSPWYPAKYRQRVYKENEDPSWEAKTNNLYWAGSTTGSHSTNGSWKFSHRQRFVDLVQNVHETPHKYMKEKKPNVWESYEAVEDLRDLFDVKLTAVIQCDESDCEAQKKYFDIGEREGNDKLYHSRLLFDLDGNSFSGRFYTLLQSRSVVLKQTILREWHDDRLIPWVHYIPVSMGMEELPEIIKYMTTNEEGQRRASQIARVSTEWRAQVLRPADVTIYLYRLLLELARLMDPKREVE